MEQSDMIQGEEMTKIEQMELEGDINFVRQRDWFDPQKHTDARVTVVGAGGIGSPTAIALTKLGIAELHVIDFDEVEAHNIPNQMYATSHAGITKVDALGALCEAFGATSVITHEGRGEDFPEEFTDVVITGLDNMDARKNMWEIVKERKDDINLYVDARLGGQDIVVYAFDPKDENAVEYYEMFALFPQEEAEEAPCTAAGIIDVSLQVASLITRAVRLHFAEGEQPEMVIQFNQKTLEITK